MIVEAQNFLTAGCRHRQYLFLNKLIKRNKFATPVILSTVICLGVGCQSLEPNASVVNSSPVHSKDLSKTSYSAEQADEIALIRTQMAAQYIKQNKLDEAKRQLEKALLANKRYAPAYDMMGVLLQTEGSRSNIIAAESYFRQAIALEPQLMKARNNYGVYLSQLKRFKEAITQFEIAGSALGYEGRIKALENLGLTTLQAGDYRLATETFVRVLERDRNNLVAHIELIDLLISSQQWNQADNLYQELLLILGERSNQFPRVVEQGTKLGY